MFVALAPTVLVWLAVMGVSFIGLTGFAADTMQWRHWTNLLVPLSLDGISVSFGGWAFVAVKRGRHPGRSYRIVLAAAATSATLNFVHGNHEWSLWAGGYLAFLSLAGMAMFHEMLEQFMAEYDDEIALKTRYPRFGRRWMWAPVSTFKALRTWIVYPPATGARPTVHNALAHWRHLDRLSKSERLDHYDQEALHRGQDHKIARRQHTGTNGHTRGSETVPAAVQLTEHQHAGTENAANGQSTSDARSNSRINGHVVTIHQRHGDAPPQMLMTNAEINAAAEDLWTDFMQQGVDLSGSKLLTEFHHRYPYPRGQRWAEYRRKAAQDRLALNRAPATVPAT